MGKLVFTQIPVHLSWQQTIAYTPRDLALRQGPV